MGCLLGAELTQKLGEGINKQGDGTNASKVKDGKATAVRSKQRSRTDVSQTSLHVILRLDQSRSRSAELAVPRAMCSTLLGETTEQDD